jgi:hypothetical protein
MLNVTYGVLAMVPTTFGVTSLSGAERQHRTACVPNMLTHLLIRKDHNDG